MDVSSLTYEELLELNKKVVAQINFLRDVKRHENMMQFNPGEKVSIDIPDQGLQRATILKLNRKTVGIITEAGEQWNVPPNTLRKLKEGKASQNKVIDLYDEIEESQG